MANSTTTLASIVTYARSYSEIGPITQSAAGGSSLQPSLTIATDTMIDIIQSVFNWKWNRFKMPLFYTNSWQQDYALNVVNLGWLEHGFLLDINNTSNPKPIWPLEVVKDLEQTSAQYGKPGQVCWLPNDQLTYGTWAASTTFTSPLGLSGMPANPLTQIQDPNGNFWVVTTYGTTGTVQPTWPTTLIFPTMADPTATATTQSDGSVVWTALNPKAAGIRCNPLPSQTGTVYQFNLIGQNRPLFFQNGPFARFDQPIEPIPDDFANAFRQGFIARAYAHSSDKAIAAKFASMHALWLKSLMDSKIQGDRERDNNGFYPATALIQQPFAIYPGPSWPYQF